MQETILILYLVVSIALVGIILLQQGKGAEMGASFGAGGANTVFGAAGSGNALTKTTTILAILFFGIALAISYLNSSPEAVIDEIYDDLPVAETQSLESELPKTELQTGGLESELPPTGEAVEEASAPATKKVDDGQQAAETKAAESKVEEVKQTVEEAVEDEPKKEGNNQ